MILFLLLNFSGSPVHDLHWNYLGLLEPISGYKKSIHGLNYENSFVADNVVCDWKRDLHHDAILVQFRKSGEMEGGMVIKASLDSPGS